MPNRNYKAACVRLVLLFALLRIVLNLFALQHYGFQRDELLHIALGDHLDWGFKEVPPLIALISKVQTAIFGSYLFATRIFSTASSAFIILLTGLLTIEFGGRRFAITVACLALTFSPCFLASGYLFQPVVFDQLWWVLSAYLLVKYFNTAQDKYLYLLGLVIGLGMLTKYTMAFFTAALVIGILFTRQRNLFTKKAIWIAVGLAIIIFLPNVIWQLTHHLPLVSHMKNLRSSQLNYVNPVDFLVQQLLDNGTAVFVWIPGLFFLLFAKKLSKYKFLAVAYIVTLLLFLILRGKSYYLFGAYPMLFAAGGYALEYRIYAHLKAFRVAAVLFFTLPNLIFLPMALPVLPVSTALPVFNFIAHDMKIDFPFKWEDQKIHLLTQDYADMFGWDELYLQVAGTYKNFTEEQKKHTLIIADNYGEAGAIHRYGKVYNLPDAVSLNSSFALWAPENIFAKYIIYIDGSGGKNAEAMLKHNFIGSCKKIGEVMNPLAVENGTAVFLLTDIKPGLNVYYRTKLLETRRE